MPKQSRAKATKTPKASKTKRTRAPSRALPPPDLQASVKVYFGADGEPIWVDYPEAGESLEAPKIQLGVGPTIKFDDPDWNLAELVNVHLYAILTLKRKDGTLMRCLKTYSSRWW